MSDKLYQQFIAVILRQKTRAAYKRTLARWIRKVGAEKLPPTYWDCEDEEVFVVAE